MRKPKSTPKLDLFGEPDMAASYKRIEGCSTIRHDLRHKMQLNCDEYVLIDAFYRASMDGKVKPTQFVVLHTGFSESEMQTMLLTLIPRGFLTNTLLPGPNWMVHFTNLDDNFDALWNTWPSARRGNQATAKRYYSKALGETTHEHIMEAAIRYLTWKKNAKTAMHYIKLLTSFLGEDKCYMDEHTAPTEQQLDEQTEERVYGGYVRR